MSSNASAVTSLLDGHDDTSLSCPVDAAPNYTLLGEARFIECSLGPRHASGDLYKVVPVTFIYTLIFITGIAGNVSTCLVIARNSQMHTATNCYLFSLAVSDILILLLGMPFDVYVMWEQYPWVFGSALCFLRRFLLEMTTDASILCITAFTFERFIAICYPIWAHKFSAISRAVKTIVVIWLVAAATAVPAGLLNHVNYLKDDAGRDVRASAWCGTDFYGSDPVYKRKVVTTFLLSTVVFFAIPMTLLAILYTKIGFTLKSPLAVTQQNQAKKSAIRMLAAVVLAFFICWAPYHTQRLMFLYCMSTGNWSPVFIRISEIMFFVAGTLYYISSTINPILYNVMSRRYRQAFRRTVCGCCDADGTPTRTGTITSYAPITQPGKNGAQMNMNEMNCGNGNMPTVVAEEFV